MCLPKSWCTKPQIPIPRGLRRNYLDEKGLLGKIAFTSTMTSKDVILEVSRVFSSPIGLSKTEIEDEGKRFNFLFLQQGGAGSRTLCRPTVADSFEWNGKHIGSLAKSGGIIYIQALDTLPFIQEDNFENDDSNTDLPPATSFNSSTPLDCDERDNDDIVENTNTTDDATIVVDHHSELVSSSIPTSSNSPCHESSNASVNSFSVSHIGERSPDNFNLQASGSAHHIASTGQSDNNNESGIAPDAKYGSSSIDSNPLDHLLTLFHATLSKKQISAIFDLACHDFDKTMECLLSGPDLNNILKLMSKVSKTYPVVKVRIDQDEIWSDLVSFYKTPNEYISKCRIRICLNDQPAIDTGGIRCQVYTSVLQQFSENQHPFKLFDGPPNSLRPYYSAATRSSGIFKILGSIVGHSIFQDGIGFPHLSTVSYWYIAAGEQAALQYLSLDDVGADCCNFICQLNKAESNQEVTAACNSEGAAELLSRVGVTHITTMANKDVVAQFVMQHEGLYKISVLLDQFKEGLRRVNIENLIESYPKEFAPLFVFSGEIRAMDVIQALYMRKDRTDPVSMGLLQQYISSLSQQELKDFMVCVTGSLVTKERSILVTFDTDANGVIAIHTCTNEISLPFGTFQETDFEHFKSSMDAIIKGSDKLTYNTV